MHGQLDLIPTVFLVGAVYYLSEMSMAAKREHVYERRFILFLTLALASKFHIAAALPLFFLYIYKRKGWKKAIWMTGLPIVLTVVVLLPFWGSGFVNMVLLNKEQQAINRVYLDYGNAHLLLTVLVLLFLYFQAFRVNQMNRDLLISMTGLLFSVFLVFVPAMPAWFIWIVPFFMLYLARQGENRGKMVLVYGGFNALYLLYYVFIHTTRFVDLYFLGRSFSFFEAVRRRNQGHCLFADGRLFSDSGGMYVSLRGGKQLLLPQAEPSFYDRYRRGQRCRKDQAVKKSGGAFVKGAGACTGGRRRP